MTNSLGSPSLEGEKTLQPSQTADSSNLMVFPHFSTGLVVKGFGRGSKQLGIPTANFPEEIVEQLPRAFQGGVYYGLAQVDNGPVYDMVMSIGNNPFYNNEKRTMETHILHDFGKDFYGSMLKTAILGYIRPMANYKSLEELIEAIQNDIKFAKEKLSLEESKSYASHSFFSSHAG